MNRHQYQAKLESYAKAHIVSPIAFAKPEDQVKMMKVDEKSEQKVSPLEESGKNSNPVPH